MVREPVRRRREWNRSRYGGRLELPGSRYGGRLELPGSRYGGRLELPGSRFGGRENGKGADTAEERMEPEPILRKAG